MSYGVDYNIPVPNGYSASEVANPKVVVQKVQGRVSNLAPEIQKIQRQISLDSWFGDGTELIDAITMPILMLAQATENMENEVTVAKKIDAEKRKALILEFLGAIFLFIPIIGEVASSISALTEVGAVLELVGIAGNVATDAYGIVSSKNVMDLVLTPLALGDLSVISRAAQIRCGKRTEEIAKLGATIAARMKSLDKIKGKCIWTVPWIC